MENAERAMFKTVKRIKATGVSKHEALRQITASVTRMEWPPADTRLVLDVWRRLVDRAYAP